MCGKDLPSQFEITITRNKEKEVILSKPRAAAATSYLLLGALAGCGGSTATTPVTPNPAYHFIAPQAGAQSVYADVVVDNLNNTLNRTLAENITAVNAEGGFTASWADASKTVTMSGAVDQTFYPTLADYNNVGQTVRYTVTPYSGSSTSCTASPHGEEVPSPLSGSQTWTLDYSLACGASPAISVSQTGEFMDTEMVAVPAGTFNAYRFVNTTVYAQGGTTITKYVTTWLNASTTDSRVLQVVTDYAYSGSTPAAQGSVVSDTLALQSYK